MPDKHSYELDFEEYIRNTEPEKKDKTYAWSTAIGLQQVDGLTPSKYLFDTAKRKIHAFGEGNTRTTAVFTIKYLRSLGFNVNNDIFAENSWYFRNALVRANYNNLKKGIHENSEYLEKFFRNLLLGEHNELKNRYCHIRYGINNGMDSNEKLVDKQATVQKLVDKWSIKPSLAEKLVDIFFFMQDKKAITTEQIVQQFGFPSTTAKRYLRELTEFGYLEASGGNKNRTYRLIQSQITK